MERISLCKDAILNSLFGNDKCCLASPSLEIGFPYFVALWCTSGCVDNVNSDSCREFLLPDVCNDQFFFEFITNDTTIFPKGAITARIS